MSNHSRHPTVVEYGVREMMKGKSPKAAAKNTEKKLGNSQNTFIDYPSIVQIDAKELEAALYERLAESVIKAMEKTKPGFEHYALDGILDNFGQKSREVRKQTKVFVTDALGHNPFVNDDRP